MKPLITLLVAAGASLGASADTPPDWSEFTRQSDNGRFEASVQAHGGGASADRDRSYRISVREAGAAKTQAPLWQAVYRYDGYSGGLLSNDGQYFAYVDFWYRHETAAVQIYHGGAYCFFTGEQLGMEPRSLAQTVSHQLWLDGSPRFAEAAGGAPAALLIPTVQGERRIDLTPEIAFRGAACIGAKNAVLSEAWLLKYAASPYNSSAAFFGAQDDRAWRQTLGQLNGAEVVVDILCADLCPRYTLRVIHLAAEPGAQCAAQGGVEKTVVSPATTQIKREGMAFCIPKILAEHNAYKR